jgi:[ribosomal protein S5]-alanine N-acetyltransferase
MTRMLIETPRLLLRDYDLFDTIPVARTLADPEVSRFMPDVVLPYGIEKARDLVQQAMQQAQEDPRRHYQLAVVLKKNNRNIGGVGLFASDSLQLLPEQEAVYEIGCWLDRSYWRQGLMQEATSRMLELGFMELDAGKIDLRTIVENTASCSLVFKLGFGLRSRGNVLLPSTGKVHEYFRYSLPREVWSQLQESLEPSYASSLEKDVARDIDAAGAQP